MTRSLILAALALGLLATAAEARSRHSAWDDDDDFLYQPLPSYVDMSPRYTVMPHRETVCTTAPKFPLMPEFGFITTCR